jgi:hypothetical protein
MSLSDMLRTAVSETVARERTKQMQLEVERLRLELEIARLRLELAKVSLPVAL